VTVAIIGLIAYTASVVVLYGINPATTARFQRLGASEAMPLLLIPGAFLSTESMTQWVAAFVARRPVIVFDQQGHGRMADTARDVIRAVRRRCRGVAAVTALCLDTQEEWLRRRQLRHP
jgi:pimeloyl-ACP methyl ester carboxylesterase